MKKKNLMKHYSIQASELHNAQQSQNMTRKTEFLVHLHTYKKKEIFTKTSIRPIFKTIFLLQNQDILNFNLFIYLLYKFLNINTQSYKKHIPHNKAVKARGKWLSECSICKILQTWMHFIIFSIEIHHTYMLHQQKITHSTKYT